MEKYSKAVSEMYLQFKQREYHPLKKYIGELVRLRGRRVEVVGYQTDKSSTAMLIVDASTCGGWAVLEPNDVVYRDCENYWYVSVNDLKNR